MLATCLDTIAASLSLRVERHGSAALPPAARYAALGLLERNHREVLGVSAGEAYAKAQEIMPELLHQEAAFVLLFTSEEAHSLVGFSASRCVEEESLHVRYVLELQIDQSLRRKGLGRALVAEARRAGEHAGACGLMLTVDARNDNALQFYTRLGFVTSPCSPSLCAPSRAARGAIRLDDGYELMVLLWAQGALETLTERGAEARQTLTHPAFVVEDAPSPLPSGDAATSKAVKRAASPSADEPSPKETCERTLHEDVHELD